MYFTVHLLVYVFFGSYMVKRLIDKYRLSRSNIYKIVKKIKALFESKRRGYRIL